MQNLLLTLDKTPIKKSSHYSVKMHSLSERSLALLNSKLKEKQEKSPQFSLRAFAKYLKISPTALSEGLRGRRGLSEATLRRIALKLHLSTLETADLLAKDNVDFEVLDEKKFALISDWEYFAVLNLCQTRGFRGDPAWIAKRLDITVRRAATVLRNLMKLGYIFQVDGQWRRIEKKLHSSTKASTKVINKCLAQDAELVNKSLRIDPVTARDSSAIAFVLTPENYKEAQILIRKLRVDLATLSEKTGKYDIPGEVYKLFIHLIPLSRSIAEENT